MASDPKYLVIMAINNLLLKRVSGGPKNQMNQSNNNIKIRPGAKEMINYLYQTGEFHLAFFTSMYANNAVICLKKLLDGKKTGISIKKNISLFAGNDTTVYLENNKIQLIKYKTDLIQKVNKELGYEKFNEKNTLIIDHLNQEEIIDEKINIYIPAIYNDFYDNWMLVLMSGFNNYLNYKIEEPLSEYMRQFILIMQDIISSAK